MCEGRSKPVSRGICGTNQASIRRCTRSQGRVRIETRYSLVSSPTVHLLHPVARPGED